MGKIKRDYISDQIGTYRYSNCAGWAFNVDALKKTYQEINFKIVFDNTIKYQNKTKKDCKI